MSPENIIQVRRRKRTVRQWHVVVLWAVVMAPLLTWGLPTSKYDEFLFGGDPQWEADRYKVDESAEARRERVSGADTDLDPIANSDRIVSLTDDDAARAAILLRYRLYSRQPDEMITFQALQRMNPRQGDFDPRLYQYGGSYIYMIGAALGLSSLFGLTTLTGDASVYLAQPELFARFYVVARVITLLFGGFTLIAVAKLAGRAAGRTAGWIALALTAASPVFITGVLEAKPHLPSTCLILWAVLSGLDYYSHGRRRDALRMGVQAGFAFGLVLTGLVGALLWPALWIARGRSSAKVMKDLALAGLIAIAVYVATNPYIPYNLLFNRAALTGNLENSTAMYSLGQIPQGVWRVGELMIEGCGLGVPIAGLIGVVLMIRRWPRRTLAAIAPGVAMLALCAAIGAGKPAEFARFLLLPAILLSIGAGALAAQLGRKHIGWGIAVMLIGVATMRTPAYVRSFYLDAEFSNESRHCAAKFLRDGVMLNDLIGVTQEPAPYAVPPLDFAHANVLLLPTDCPTRTELGRLPPALVLTADDSSTFEHAWWRPHYDLTASFAAEPRHLSRIAWANKPVFVFQRRASDSN